MVPKMPEMPQKRSKRNRATAKAAGTRFESLVASGLSAFGAYRPAKAGAKDKGDIHFHYCPWLILECKDTVSVSLPQWWRETLAEVENAGAAVGAIVHKRTGSAKPREQWVTMDLETFSRLISAVDERELADRWTDMTPEAERA